jgi:hydroxyacylglutathione hydrolase
MNIKKVVVGSLQTNCYLLFAEKDMVIVDPGDDAAVILKEVEKIGVNPKFVINTHSHFDHVGANREVLSKTNAKLLENLKEGDEIKIGSEKLFVIETPGHTDDSVSLLGDNFIISGDVLFSRGYGRTDLPGGCDEKMKNTLDLLDKKLSGETIVYPGHGDCFLKKDWCY